MSSFDSGEEKLEGVPSGRALEPSEPREYNTGKTLRFALIAVGLCVVVAIYSNPANFTPADPVATSFFP